VNQAHRGTPDNLQMRSQSFSADDLYQDEEEEDIQDFEQDGEDGASLAKTDGETEDEKPEGLADDSTLYFYGW
jgi:hypothetical protein